MRVAACAQVGVRWEGDRAALLGRQCGDGGWEGGWMYQYGSTRVRVGNRGVTTAMAVFALSVAGGGERGVGEGEGLGLGGRK